MVVVVHQHVCHTKLTQYSEHYEGLNSVHALLVIGALHVLLIFLAV